RPPVEQLEGCYTLLILDKVRARVQIYRNLCSNHSAYYAERNGRLWFSGNLANILRVPDLPVAPNRPILPLFFLYRTVPGAETLCEGVRRLLPGELLTYDERGLKLVRCQTLSDMYEGPTKPDIVDRLEEALTRVIADIANIDPKAGTFFSGGVDSCLLQVYWNKAIQPYRLKGQTFELVVDHFKTRQDHEYAVSAATLLNTNHQTVRAGRLFAKDLIEQMRLSGEPPYHVQTPYTLPLARCLQGRGCASGLYGEGADSLFGTDWGPVLARAQRLERLPGATALGPCAAAAARLLRRPGWAEVFSLVGKTADYSNPRHPVNRVATYTQLEVLQKCFSSNEVARALAYMRDLLSASWRPRDAFRAVDFAGLLNSAVLDASLCTNLCKEHAVQLFCPYLDSRIVRIAANTDWRYRYRRGQTKWVLKALLTRHLPKSIVGRPKRGFGQPIFEWLSERGQLRRYVDRIEDYDFVPRSVRERCLAAPGWFLYSLLCYDLWRKIWVEGRREVLEPDVQPFGP
ncbi:MAG: asparagine synthase-related protein, partial [Phycisphaerae bacterium]